VDIQVCEQDFAFCVLR